MISMEEVAKHNKKDDLWVVIHGKVYDLTPFIDSHPGGVGPILAKAGKDGTKAFDAIHPSDIVNQLPEELHIGDLDPTTKGKSFCVGVQIFMII